MPLTDNYVFELEENVTRTPVSRTDLIPFDKLEACFTESPVRGARVDEELALSVAGAST